MSTYSPDLRIELITTGDQAGTWGSTTNTNLGTIIEDAISGYTQVTIAATKQAFSVVNGAVDEARSAMIQLNSAAANFAVYAPPVSKQYIIRNNTSYTAAILNSTIAGNTTTSGTGTGVVSGIGYYVETLGSTTLPQWQTLFNSLTALPVVGQTITATATGSLAGGATVAATVIIASGEKMTVFTNGTNFYGVDVSGVVGTAHGGTGLTSYAANGVLYALNANTLYNNTNFVFDGTNVGIGETTPATYGKLVVGGTGSFTTSLVSTSTTLSDKPTLEFRKTVTGSTLGVTNNVIGRVSFYSQSGSSGTTPTETAYISARNPRNGSIDTAELKIATYSGSVGVEVAYVNLGTTSLDLYTGQTNGITFNGPKYTFLDAGNNFKVEAVSVFSNGLDVSAGALTVASVPVVTTTGTQTLTNKTLSSPLTMATSVITSGTVQATTSGTSKSFSGIPSWVKRVTVMFNQVSTNGTAYVRVQIGPVAGVETTGYLGTCGAFVGTSLNTIQLSSGFDIYDGTTAAAVRNGALTLTLVDSATNTWAATGTIGQSDYARIVLLGGVKALAGALSIVTITTSNGTDTFDAGSVNILYE